MDNPMYAPSRNPTSAGTHASLGDATATEAALQLVEEQVLRVWDLLTPTSIGAPAIFEQAIRLATPIVPCVVAPRPLSARDLNRDLRIALVNYHAEEIRVVGYTLFSSIVELVYEKCGKRLGGRVEHILDAHETTH